MTFPVPRKYTFCAELAEKSFCWDFEVLPPDYVTTNVIFSPILHVKRYHSRQK